MPSRYVRNAIHAKQMPTSKFRQQCHNGATTLRPKQAVSLESTTDTKAAVP
jgi:hypothetical protein